MCIRDSLGAASGLGGGFGTSAHAHIFCRLSRSALVTTLTEDSAIAAAAMIGESRMPNSG